MVKFLLAIIFGFLLYGIVTKGIVRFFGMTDKNRPTNKSRPGNKSQQYTNSPDTSQKEFSKNEGEYVDYEEVKDND
jgi:hypothetical protein